MTTITREHLELAAKAAGYVDIDEPAFPRDHQHDGHNGMTLRDYFAAKAMQAALPDMQANSGLRGVAVVAYQMADAMLAERSKP